MILTLILNLQTTNLFVVSGTNLVGRTLIFSQTYLNPDGFLGGLNLNRENTQLRPDFEIVLQFYGFDLTADLSNFTSNNGSNFGLQGSLTTTTLAPGQTMMPATMGVTVSPTTTPMSAAAGMVGGSMDIDQFSPQF